MPYTETEKKAIIKKLFTYPVPTIEAAQNFNHCESGAVIEPAAVFRTPEGKYVLGMLSVYRWSMHYLIETADRLREELDLEMVSYSDPMFGTWCKFEKGESNGHN